jgi:hypothetical protein
MSEDKYIGLDVHQTSVSVAVLNREGKLTGNLPVLDRTPR